MAKSGAIRAGRAFVEIFADDSALVRGLNRAEKRLKAFGASLRSVGTRMMGMGGALVTPMLAAAKVFDSTGSALVDMAARTGASVEALSALGYAASQTGTDMGAVEAGFRRMQKTVAAAAGGSKQAQAALAALGLTAADLAGLAPEDQFDAIAAKIAAIPDATARAAAAMGVFGRAGTALVPMAADLSRLTEEARRLGLVVSTQDAQAADAFGDSLGTLWASIKMGVFQIGAALAPLLKDLAGRFVAVMTTVSDWLTKNRDLVVTVFKVAAAVVAAGAALWLLGAGVTALAAVFGTVATVVAGVGTALSAVAAVVGFLLSPIGLVVAALVGLAAYFAYSADAGGKAMQWLGDVIGGLKEDATAAIGGISDALAAGDLGLAARIAWAFISLEFQKGVNWIKGLWAGFTGFFVSVWNYAVGNAAKIMLNIWYGVQSAWNEFVTGLTTVWYGFTDSIINAWKSAQNLIAKGYISVMEKLGVYTKEVADSARDILEQDYQKAAAQRNAENAARINANEDAGKKTRESLNAEWDQALKNVDAETAAKEKKRTDAADAARQEREDAIRAAQAELAALTKEAAAKKAGKKLADVQKPKTAAVPDLALTAAEQKFSTAGSFNAAAVRGMGAGSAADRTARATERSADRLERIERNTRDMLEAELEFA